MQHFVVAQGTLGWTLDIPNRRIVIGLYSADRGQVDHTHVPGQARDGDERGALMISDPEVVVFHKPGCPFAARLRVGLRLARIPYRAQPFRDDEKAAALVRDANGGNEVSPTVLVRGIYLTNPNVRSVRAALL